MKKKRPSGGACLAKSGRRPMLIGVTPEAHQKIRLAAAWSDTSMAKFVAGAALEAAETILRKKKNSA